MGLTNRTDSAARGLVRVAALLALALPGAGCGDDYELSTPRVRAALEAIEAERIAEHMRYLAGDELGGRGTGTPGHLMAADYVASAFEELGLRPAGESGSFYQQVPLAGAELLRGQSSLALLRGDGRTELRNGVHYVMEGDFTRQRAEITAPVVFAGFGVTAPELDYDDYAGIDVRGKIVAQFHGAPPTFPHNQRAYYASSRVKAQNAVERGAVGVIGLLTPQDRQRRPWDRIVSHAAMTSMRWLEAGGEPRDGFPELFVRAMLSAEGEEVLFEGAPHGLEAVVAAAEAGRPLSFELPARLEARTASRHSRLESPNVAALLPGSDPELRDEYVVLTGHLDHVGVGHPVEGDRIHNGAYDNASGIAIMLEIARALSGLDPAPRRSLLFLAVTGEEKGLLGSDYFVAHPTVELESVVAAINLDMVLMLHPLRDVVAFGAEHSSLAEAVELAARHLGLKLGRDPVPEEVLFIRSDQFPFVRRGIPALFMVSGFDSGDPAVDGMEQWLEWMRAVYHTPQDDMSQEIDFEAGAAFARVNLLVAYLVADRTERPRWNSGDFFGEKFDSS